MSENEIIDYLKKAYQYKRTVAFGLSLLGIFIVDLTVGPALPFWLSPLVLGIISGFVIVSASAGLFSAAGAITGRLLSILVMVLTVPAALATANLFIAAIGDFIGASLPAGELIVIILSMLICGAFAALGGAAGGSLARIIQIYMAAGQEAGDQEKNPE